MSELNRKAWEALVAYAYQDGKDGARVVQQITEHYLEMRAALAEFTTLYPAAKWTEADGRVIWWVDCPSGHPMPCEMARGSDAVCGRAATERFDFWSLIPKGELGEPRA